MFPRSAFPRHGHRRPGSAYILVLGTAVMLGVIGLAGLKLTRVKNRQLSCSNNARAANFLALSAIEYGLAQLDAGTAGDQANWRTTHTSGTQSAPSSALEHGTMQWMLVDERDDNLGTANDTDPVRLYGIGHVGDITRVYSVLLSPTVGQGLNCLGSAIHAHGSIYIDSPTEVLTASGAPASTNTAYVSSGVLQGDLEADRVQSQGTVSGSVTEGSPDKDMPPASVFDYYVKSGTKIDITGLPEVGGTRTLENGVLSPTNNPFGKRGLNARGIYVIDCGSGSLRVRNMRIVGTLVLVNVNTLYLAQALNWEPAISNYPALLANHSGNPEVQVSNTLDTLTEGGGLNFNPPGTPYEGAEDKDELDTYPTLIRGLVYTDANLHFWADLDFHGVVLANGYIQLTGAQVEVQHDSIYLTNPPPGFSGNGPMTPMAGTWKRTTLP